MTCLAAKPLHIVRVRVQGASLKIKTHLGIKFIWLLILETIGIVLDLLFTNWVRGMHLEIQTKGLLFLNIIGQLILMGFL